MSLPLRPLRARLRDTRGFMLAEQLMSIIFLGLLSIMVAAGLGAALSAYGSITEKAQADSMLSRAVEEVSDELAFARNVEGAEQPLFESASRHEVATINGNDQGIWLQVESGRHVLIAPVQNGLVPSIRSLAYNERTGNWTFAIEIARAGSASTSDALASAELTVHRIG